MSSIQISFILAYILTTHFCVIFAKMVDINDGKDLIDGLGLDFDEEDDDIIQFMGKELEDDLISFEKSITSTECEDTPTQQSILDEVLDSHPFCSYVEYWQSGAEFY